MLKTAILFFCLLIGVKNYAQNVVKGNIKDENGKPAVNVNLILYPKIGNTILAYTTTNNLGSFTLSYTVNTDSLRLELTSLAYEKKQFFLASQTTTFLTLHIKSAVNNLPEIIIKDERPITQKGDTINYNVKSFADKSDRVIIDVIKNLPGIKITEGGQILYQDKAINKFYVDGKDLLENRYNLATNNLPVDAVDLVQVLENHQPIKLLNGIEQSDRAAINIKLNKNAKLKLLGNGNLGLGITPLLSNNNIALLKFSKSIQYINTAKNNNVGVNLDNELNDQIFNANTILSGGFKQDLLNVVNVAPPPLKTERYTFNNNTVATSNYLVGLNKLFNLKFNFAYENDNLKNKSNTITNIYLPTDTIVINENKTDKSTYDKILAGLILEANTRKKYFKNTLRLQKIWSNEEGFISLANITQNLHNPFINVVNDFIGMLNVKDNLIGVSSYTSYTNLPQSLSVFPGQYNTLLNGGMPYNALLQKAESEVFFSNNTLSFGKKFGEVIFNNKVGILVNLQNLNNDLSLIKNDIATPAIGEFENQINRNELQLYNEANVSYNTKKINISFGLNANTNVLSNKGRGLNQNLNKTFINPNLKLKYNINPFLANSLNISADNDISYLANPTFILQNYRNLVNSDIPFYKTKNKVISYTINYKNIINAIFGNISVSYIQKNSNVLLQTKFNQALTTQTAIVQNNPSSSLNFSGNINKYYIAIKTDLDFSFNYKHNLSKQLQQAILTDFVSNSVKFGTRISTQFSERISITHVLELIRFKNASKQNFNLIKYEPISFLNQNLNFNLNLPKNYATKFSFEHYYNKSNNLKPVNHLFADFTLQKSVSKPKLDYSISLVNIFNTKSYTNYTYLNNYLISTNYALRGRMLMFRLGFQF